MSQVAITTTDDGRKSSLPVFGEIAKRFKAIERRAFELFEEGGRRMGRDLEDWLKAEHELLGSPPAELSEKDGVYEMHIALPGFHAKEVEITATPSGIVVHAAAKRENQAEKDNIVWSEFGSSDVYRHFELPNRIEVDKVTADLENGLLRINAPEVPKPKAVPANAA